MIALKFVTPLLQFSAQLAMIVNLSVKDDDELSRRPSVSVDARPANLSTARRRLARCTGGTADIQVPESSGPRCLSKIDMRSSVSPEPEPTKPQMPHIRSASPASPHE